MGKLIYSLTTTLDGYVADENGNFDWAVPTEEIHAFVDNFLRNTGTFLFGRKMYETMKVWDDIPSEGTSGPMDGPSQAMNDFAKIYHAANKIIYSTTLQEVTTANTTLERTFDAEAIKRMVASSDKDFGIGGPTLAADAIKANIVDEYHQYIVPIMIGDGNYWLPKGAKNNLELVDVHKFDNGTVHLQYSKV